MFGKRRSPRAPCAALPLLLLLLLLPLCAGAEGFRLAHGAPDGAERISLYRDRTGCYLSSARRNGASTARSPSSFPGHA